MRATLGRSVFLIPAAAAVALGAWAATLFSAERGADGGPLTVYSGRSRELVEPLFQRFEEESGIKVLARYGETAELAATILEEGRHSPADLFFAQDAGALGALARHEALAGLPENLLERVPGVFRSPEGLWVGVSGRARVVVYNTRALDAEGLPDSIHDFADPRWKGRIGWAPTNGSFQAFVTGLRKTVGEEAAEAWLRGIKANQPKDYPSNARIVQAVGEGEVEVGFVNHYYLHQFLKERGGAFPARNHYTAPGDPGSLVNIAGLAVLRTTRRPETARRLAEFLLSDEAQRHFAEKTFEYPLVEGVPAPEGLVPLDEIEPPDIDLSDLSDLEGTLDLLRKTGALP